MITDRELLVLCDLTNLKIEYMENKRFHEETKEFIGFHSLYSLVESELKKLEEKTTDSFASKYNFKKKDITDSARVLTECYAALKRAKENGEVEVTEDLKFMDELEVISLIDSYTLTKDYYIGVYEFYQKLAKGNSDATTTIGEMISSYPTRDELEGKKFIEGFKVNNTLN